MKLNQEIKLELFRLMRSYIYVIVLGEVHNCILQRCLVEHFVLRNHIACQDYDRRPMKYFVVFA